MIKPNLVALASTSLLQLSGRTSGLSNQKFIGPAPIGSTWICCSEPAVSLPEKSYFSTTMHMERW